MLVVKRTTSLFNSFCSNNVARQVARLSFPVFPYLYLAVIYLKHLTGLIHVSVNSILTASFSANVDPLNVMNQKYPNQVSW